MRVAGRGDGRRATKVVGDRCEAIRKRQEQGLARAAGVAQLVERKPSKLDVAGSSPVSRSTIEGRGSRERGGHSATQETARVAQSVEHTLGKGEVIGSIPIASSE